MHNIIEKEQWITPQQSVLIYYHIYYTFCIGSPTKRHWTQGASDLGQHVSDVLVLVRQAGEAHPEQEQSLLGRCWEAPCQLLSQTTFQLVRGEYMILLLHKIKGSTVWEGGGTSPQMGCTEHTRRKSTLGPPHAAWISGYQQPKGHKIYLLFVFLFLFHLFRTAGLLSHLLPALIKIQKEPWTTTLTLPPFPGAEHVHNVY